VETVEKKVEKLEWENELMENSAEVNQPAFDTLL
jgi:hypothetical protein